MAPQTPQSVTRFQHGTEPPTPFYTPAPYRPDTPRTGAALDNLFRSLDGQYQFGLKVGDKTGTPDSSTSITDKLRNEIKRQHFQGPEILSKVLEQFQDSAKNMGKEKRAEALYWMLYGHRSKQKSGSQTPSIVSTSTALSSNQTPKSLNLSRDLRTKSNTEALSTITHSESITNDGGDFDKLPPSPSPAPRYFLRNASGKQRLEPTSTAGPSTISSPSLSRTPVFVTQSTQESNSTQQINESFSSVWSTQTSQTDTIDTSFTSDDDDDDDDDDVCYPTLSPASSTVYDSCDDEDLVNACTVLDIRDEFEDEPGSLKRDSVSSYGSFDEDSFLEAEAASLSPSPNPMTPNQSIRQLSLSRSPNLTSRVLPFWISRIPEQNLFVDDIPVELHSFPYFVLFICCRYSTRYKVPMHELMQGMDSSQVLSKPGAFWSQIKARVPNIEPRDPRSIWKAPEKSLDGYTFKGRIVFVDTVKESSPVLKLELEPVQEEWSCRFQRKFGSDRFLYLTVPCFKAASKQRQKPGRLSGDYINQIGEQFSMWRNREHSFLGRKWRVFHLEPRKNKSAREKDEPNQNRIILFATEGLGLEKKKISLGEMLNWFFPFQANQDENCCKAFARFDLGLSRTIPALVFKPSQVLRKRDTYSDGKPEATQFDDRTLDWSESCNSQVMNDGCSRMSVGAALKILEAYGEETKKVIPMPSAFQGRIGGAKGMWMINAEPHSQNPEDLDIWIEITDSQLKFDPHPEDENDQTFDQHRLTFEYCDHSSSGVSSDLHFSFIPILEDRHVPKEVIAKITIKQLDQEREQLLEDLPDPVRMHASVHKDHLSTQNNAVWQAGLPFHLSDKVQFLLQNGLHPQKSPFLGAQLHKYIRKCQIKMEEKLRVPLEKSSNLFGLADPLGVLAPGEVHIRFSTPFVAEASGHTYRSLHGLELLVARQPACRRSDMQKVRAIEHPQLSHLVDVVVFSTQGQYPLAGKLQGGDYDGDKFWFCWEKDLTQRFKNAPAPLHDLNPADYKIKRNRKKVRDVMDPRDLSTVDELLKLATEFRTDPACLGLVTIFREKLAYKKNKVYSEVLNDLCDMHSLLVDAPKQAYTYGEEEFKKLKRTLLGRKDIEKPAYQQAMDKCRDGNEKDDLLSFGHNPNNVLDYLYFDVIRRHNIETMRLVKEALPVDKTKTDKDEDPDLQFPYLQLRETGNEAIQQELDILLAGFDPILDHWNANLAGQDTASWLQFSQSASQPPPPPPYPYPPKNSPKQ